jgi:hypothetical protein
MNPQAGGVESSGDVLPRITVPKRVVAAPGQEAAAQLAGLDPRELAVVAGPSVESQDPGGAASVAHYEEGRYRIRYNVKSPSLIRVAEAYYPGWQAIAGGRALEVRPVDRALLGFVVPAGEGEVDLTFRLRRFDPAAALSLFSAITAATILLGSLLRARPATSASPSELAPR